MIKRTLLTSALAVASLVAAGCGKNKLSKVEGVVTVDGAPLAGATVSFLPEQGEGRPATGLTGDDGSFQLTSFSTGDGARAGDYKIVVTVGEVTQPYAPPNPNDPGAVKKAMADYAAAKRKKETAPKKPAIHPNYSDPKKTPLRQRVPVDGKVELNLKKSGS